MLNGTAKSVDWVQGTFQIIGTHVVSVGRIKSLWPNQEWRDADKLMRPYTEGIECQYGTLMWHPSFAEFGIFLRISGHNLSNMRESGWDDETLLDELTNSGWRASRLDFAVDVVGQTNARPEQIFQAWKRKEIKTKARTVKLLQDQGPDGLEGETVYIGSRTSEKMLRVYDKALERKQNDIDWVRIEIELKGEHARNAVRAVKKVGLALAAKSYIRSVVEKTDIAWFEEAINEEDLIDVQALGRKQTDWELWFWKIVIPALDKALRTNVYGARRAIKKMLAAYGEHGP